MKRVLLAVIRYYQRVVSPGLPATCKYQPTCSRYAYEAIERFGALRGGFMAGHRLLRCMPWSAGGFDPVSGPALIRTPIQKERETRTMPNPLAVPRQMWPRRPSVPHGGDPDAENGRCSR